MKKLYLLFFNLLAFYSLSAQTAYTINVSGSGGIDCNFTPPSITIGLMDTIYFDHLSGVPHTSYTTPAGNPPNMWQCSNLNNASQPCGPIWFTNTGTYTYNCNLHGGNGGTITVNTVGIREPKDGERSITYPNPFAHTTMVAFGKSKVEVVEVYDLVGNLMLSQPVANGANYAELDLSHLANGAYFYRLVNKGTVIESKRLIKHE